MALDAEAKQPSYCTDHDDANCLGKIPSQASSFKYQVPPQPAVCTGPSDTR